MPLLFNLASLVAVLPAYRQRATDDTMAPAATGGRMERWEFGGRRRTTGLAKGREAALELDIVTTREAFDALEHDWTELYGRAGHAGQPFQSFAWCWHWANHFLGPPARGERRCQLSILTARQGGRLVLVWPLVKEWRLGVIQLRFMGEPVTEYGDVLIDPAVDAMGTLRAAWAHLTANARADAIVLANVREDAAVAPFRGEIGAMVTKVEGAPYIDLSKARDYGEYAKKYSSRTLSVRRRKRARLKDRGELVHRELTCGRDAAAAAREIITLKKRWLKEKGVVSRALSDDRTLAFFADVAEGRGKPTGCRILTLQCGETMVAAELTFVVKGRLVNHVLVYDTDYDKQSPGVLLTEDSLKRCMEGGIERYDFMGPADPYKLEWSDGVTEVKHYAIPRTLKGKLFVDGYLRFGRERIKQIIRMLPVGLRRSLAGVAALLATPI